MKILKISGIMLLVGLVVFFGFHFFFADEKESEREENTYQQEIGYYRTLVAELEARVSQLNQEHYGEKSQYEEQIEQLRLLLEAEQTLAESPTPVTYVYAEKNGELTITGYQGDVDVLLIPSSINGLPVVAIGPSAFRGATLSEAVVPDTVRRIDWFAFYECAELTAVTLPSSITMIEYGAFDGCGNLTVRCEAESYAHKYAQSYGLRALLV